MPNRVQEGQEEIGRIGAGPWASLDEQEKQRIRAEIEQRQVLVRHGFGKAFVKRFGLKQPNAKKRKVDGIQSMRL